MEDRKYPTYQVITPTCIVLTTTDKGTAEHTAELIGGHIITKAA